MDVGLVCDACSALTPIGVPQCARCGAAVALDPRPSRQSRPPPVAAASAACPSCATPIGPGQRFCPSCGHRVGAPVAPVSPSSLSAPAVTFDGETRVGPRAAAGSGPHSAGKVGRATMTFATPATTARAKLTLIRGDGEDGVSFTLAGQDHLAGRGECPISFPDDPFLSPTHANFFYRSRVVGPPELVVRDEGSLNGVFVRISGTVPLEPGATVLVGEQVLTIAHAPQAEDLPDHTGTYFSASMPRPATMEIRQTLRGGTSGWVYRVDGDVVVLGREGNDINFPEDPFISGRHAELRVTDGKLSVTDLRSRNGTFVRISGERTLAHGDFVFLGQQLLRVEIV